jgi:hypothetical protein
VTERKPPGVSFETWIDRQIREAQARGELDGLAGAGKPIADLDGPEDELWWVKRKLARENVTFLPPTLALRKDAERALEAVAKAPSEQQVRRIMEEINIRIREAHRKPMAGPPLRLAAYDVDGVVDRWRTNHPEPVTADPPPPPVSPPTTRGRRWGRGRGGPSS